MQKPDCCEASGFFDGSLGNAAINKRHRKLSAKLPSLYSAFCAMSLATITPLTEACMSPRVMPAPSPIA